MCRMAINIRSHGESVRPVHKATASCEFNLTKEVCWRMQGKALIELKERVVGSDLLKSLESGPDNLVNSGEDLI
jgi:hypothetical protein